MASRASQGIRAERMSSSGRQRMAHRNTFRLIVNKLAGIDDCYTIPMVSSWTRQLYHMLKKKEEKQNEIGADDCQLEVFA